MSVTVNTVEPTDFDITFHNGFAWFLDAVFGGRELPDHFFGQGAGESRNDPGALPPERCGAFAAALDTISDGVLEARMMAAMRDCEADDDMVPAIATVRELVELAKFARQHGGLRTRSEDRAGYVEPAPTRTVVLSEESFAVLCGLVQPQDDVNASGIFSEAWDELRRTFPIEHFRQVAQERGEDFYSEDAGT